MRWKGRRGKDLKQKGLTISKGTGIGDRTAVSEEKGDESPRSVARVKVTKIMQA